MRFKVSIIIRAYNSEKLVARAIESAVSQDFPKDKFEVVVVNDGSNDGTLNVIEKYSKRNRNVRLIDQENEGAVRAGNNGFAASRSEYIVMLDDDDYFAPNLVSVLSKILDDNEDLDFVYSDYWEEFKSGRVLIRPQNIFETIAGGVMFRRSSLGANLWTEGLFFPEYDNFLKHPYWRGWYHPVALFTYVRSKESLSGDNSRVKNGIDQLKKLHPDKISEIEKIRSYSL